jgi:acid stress-induced BolA-like protein IbaG/YrbA
MDLDAIKAMIEEGFSEAEVRVSGEGCNLEATVISPEFAGLSRIQQHRKVQDQVKHLVASGELHAISVKTLLPES